MRTGQSLHDVRMALVKLLQEKSTDGFQTGDVTMPVAPSTSEH